ncbi:MAG: hypothetical protein FWG11_08795 [Promicromonosporaceae bacterium]|nr:hypothetical protein [Promicromonosporaceae bacterium]
MWNLLPLDTPPPVEFEAPTLVDLIAEFGFIGLSLITIIVAGVFFFKGPAIMQAARRRQEKKYNRQDGPRGQH